MDGYLRELLATSRADTSQFFLESLKDAVGMKHFRDDEIEYVAQVLSHYAQTSRYAVVRMPVMDDLSDIFDHFIFHTQEVEDPEVLECGGSQILLFAGYFRDQVRRRHNVEWYDEVGQSFYYRAGQCTRDSKRRKLFAHLSETFPVWTVACMNMSRMLRQNHLLLRFD